MRIFLLTLALTFALPAFAAPKRNIAELSCPELYALTAEQLAGIKPEFLAGHNSGYTIEVPTTPIRSQCQYGSCWIYGTLADVEAQILREKGVKLDLSEQYLILQSLQERIALALASPGKQLEEGGLIDIAQRLMETHGMLPASAWQPRVPFESDPHKKRLMSFLQNRIGRFHVDAAKQPGRREKLLAETKADLQAILNAYVGEPPKSFTYNGIKFASPLAFAKEFLPAQSDLVMMQPQREALEESLLKLKPASHGNKPMGPRGKRSDLTVSIERMEKSIVDSLKKGHTVPFGSEMAHEFIDKETGIMSTHAFYTPPGFTPAPRAYRTAFGISGGGHAMMIVGVDLDQSGKVIKFKVKNSWGTKSGDEGFYHMYEDYFREYVLWSYSR